MPEKRDPSIAAVEVIHAALKPLDPDARQRVLWSVQALLDVTAAAVQQVPAKGSQVQSERQPQPGRPMALVELMQDKSPGTNSQRIALFAYYRERYEGTPRFGRADLRSYFAKARENPPKNFDRDFVEALRRGWVHEEGDQSYLTSKGVEAVEAGFPGERAYKRGTTTKKSGRRKGARKKGLRR